MNKNILFLMLLVHCIVAPSAKQECARTKTNDHPLSAAHSAALVTAPINKAQSSTVARPTVSADAKVVAEKESAQKKDGPQKTDASKKIMAFDRTGKVQRVSAENTQRTRADLDALAKAMKTINIDRILMTGETLH